MNDEQLAEMRATWQRIEDSVLALRHRVSTLEQRATLAGGALGGASATLVAILVEAVRAWSH